MKIKIFIFVLSTTFILVSGCKSYGPDGKLLWIAGDPCSETWKQVSNDYDVTVDLATKAKITGKLTQEKLIEIDKDAGNYRAQAKDLCAFFYDGKIKYAEYDQGIQRINDQYKNLKASIPN